MAEMTASEAIESLKIHGTLINIGKRTETYRTLSPAGAAIIAEFIERQAEKIEKSKRCGNCEHAKEHWDELYGCKLNEDAKFNRRNTCERWELVK